METEVLRKQNLNRNKKNTENDNGNTRVVLLSRHLHGLAQSFQFQLCLILHSLHAHWHFEPLQFKINCCIVVISRSTLLMLHVI